MNVCKRNVRIRVGSLRKSIQVHTTRPRNLTHVRALGLGYRLHQSFIVLNKKQMSTICGLVSIWWNEINGFLCSLGGSGFPLARNFSHTVLDKHDALTRQPQYPTTLTQEILPFSNKCPMMSPQPLCCCVTLPYVSCMPMTLVNKCDHPKTKHSHMLALNLSNIQQNRRLRKKPSLHSLALSPT